MANPILVGEDFFALKDKHPEQQKIADLFDPEKNEAITGVFATPAFAEAVKEKVLEEGDDSIKTTLFADTAFSDKVQEIVNGMFDNADTTQYGGRN